MVSDPHRVGDDGERGIHGTARGEEARVRHVEGSHAEDPRFAADPHWRELVRFYEYFHGDTGRGIGASFQGWSTLVARCLEDVAAARRR